MNSLITYLSGSPILTQLLRHLPSAWPLKEDIQLLFQKDTPAELYQNFLASQRNINQRILRSSDFLTGFAAGFASATEIPVSGIYRWFATPGQASTELWDFYKQISNDPSNRLEIPQYILDEDGIESTIDNVSSGISLFTAYNIGGKFLSGWIYGFFIRSLHSYIQYQSVKSAGPNYY